MTAVRGRLPEAELRSEVGRLFVRSADRSTAEVIEVLGAVHGISSFSPVAHCDLADLGPCVVRFAMTALAGKRSFCLAIKRVGKHSFGSQRKAAELGALICEHAPHLVVDLAAPDVTIGVEIRDSDCYVFETVIPGLDRSEAGAEPQHGREPQHGQESLRGQEPRFLVDQMLGRLVPWLRVLGFDTTYMRDLPDSALLRSARHEDRIILTRDRELSLARSAAALYVHGREPIEQIEEIAAALALRIAPEQLFTRCTLCNRPVHRVDKHTLQERLPAMVYERYDEFTWCAACDKVYWKGGQYERIVRALERLGPLAQAAQASREPGPSQPPGQVKT